MYKLYKYLDKVVGAYKEDNSMRIYFTFEDPANTDYANFKTAILEDKAQLQDAEGKQMSAEQAKQFVSTLP